MKFEQSPGALLMVRPSSFGFNTETDGSNAFQHMPDGDQREISRAAVKEFDAMVTELRKHSIDVHVFQDDASLALPDAVFPNNWISLHPDGTIILYPMMAASRRKERREDIVGVLSKGFNVTRVLDVSHNEQQDKFLEGTGSIVFDHMARTAFACRSPRTNESLFRDICDRINYKAIVFDAVDERGVPVYHTNVMMSIAQHTAVICLDAIRDESHQELLLDHLSATGRKIIAISMDQLHAFAGNMIEVMTANGQLCMILSETALQSMLPGQINALSIYSEIIPVSIPTIQRYGGGSVRCMVAGIHLQRLH